MGGSCPAWAGAVLLWEVVSQGNAKEKPGKAEHHTASCTASLWHSQTGTNGNEVRHLFSAALEGRG